MEIDTKVIEVEEEKKGMQKIRCRRSKHNRYDLLWKNYTPPRKRWHLSGINHLRNEDRDGDWNPNLASDGFVSNESYQKYKLHKANTYILRGKNFDILKPPNLEHTYNKGSKCFKLL